jgi:hypothetical protein
VFERLVCGCTFKRTGVLVETVDTSAALGANTSRSVSEKRKQSELYGGSTGRMFRWASARDLYVECSWACATKSRPSMYREHDHKDWSKKLGQVDDHARRTTAGKGRPTV